MSILRCRRPAYLLPRPPQAKGSAIWLKCDNQADFWEMMEKLFSLCPDAPPEQDLEEDKAMSRPHEAKTELNEFSCCPL